MGTAGDILVERVAALVRLVCDEGYRREPSHLQTLYHVMEQFDAVQVLVAAGAVEPSKLQLRG